MEVLLPFELLALVTAELEAYMKVMASDRMEEADMESDNYITQYELRKSFMHQYYYEFYTY